MQNPEPYLLLCLRLLLAAIFLYYGLGKLKRPRLFGEAVRGYHLVPRGWAQPFAFTLIGLEIAIGGLVLIGWHTRLAAASGGVLLSLFIVAMGINLVRGRTDLDCGCAGNRQHQVIGRKIVLRNVAYLTLALPVMLWGGGYLSIDALAVEARTIFFETIVIAVGLPLALSGAGLYLAGKLGKATLRLVALTPIAPPDRSPKADALSASPQSAGSGK